MNKKKLLYMSRHRGCKEMDIILGNFAEKKLEKLTENELEIYARLILETDQDLYSGLVSVMYGHPIPAHLNYAEALLMKIGLENPS